MPELGIFHHPTLASVEAALGQQTAPLAGADAAGLHEVLTASLQRFSASHHGDFERWQSAIGSMPRLTTEQLSFGDTILVQGQCNAAETLELHSSLFDLRPWRKGPFRLFDLHIDSEWRSDWKWQRLVRDLPEIQGHRVLDVGCGNGYFGWRLLAAGAAAVIGIDPTLLFCMQHLAVNQFIRSDQNWVLPLRLEDLPTARTASLDFDGALSMGVIYHRRQPQEHLARLYQCIRSGGWLVLESLIVQAAEPIYPAEMRQRYARMRNVWCVPTVDRLRQWLQAEGFTSVELLHEGETSTLEQRSTQWMDFESLTHALDPKDRSLTVEGWPRPRRALLLARRP